MFPARIIDYLAKNPNTRHEKTCCLGKSQRPRSRNRIGYCCALGSLPDTGEFLKMSRISDRRPRGLTHAACDLKNPFPQLASKVPESAMQASNIGKYPIVILGCNAYEPWQPARLDNAKSLTVAGKLSGNQQFSHWTQDPLNRMENKPGTVNLANSLRLGRSQISEENMLLPTTLLDQCHS